ncbi:peptide/nickel transport system substrate-binding protein [Mesorhizobium soli]|uniref:ABC transporter substrate-binding protein n=1 Tax=Pseudaminobacter soli (ex Li et al. 2025) TaxID=1295366 RepID=UPI002473C74B|nr:ABC transporter substrate-binding protein [Mesorhizobium soli]MDH6234625.1 peptide/nickel transport system substrate-binding protein [Mesorhizobium soli]
MKHTLRISILACFALFGASASLHSAERGGTFNFVAPYDGSILTLDPHKTAKQQDLLVTNNIFRTLYMWSTEEQRPVLEMAESAVVSEDGLTYTYTLKDGMTFHNGRKLVASDIAYSYERMLTMDPVSPSSGFLQVIVGAEALQKGKVDHLAGVKVINDRTFSITLTEKVDPAYQFYQPGTAIVPKEEVERLGDKFGLTPIGSGPFMFKEWVPGSEVSLVKYPGYYEEGKPYLDSVAFKIMQEGASRDIAFRAKELDAIIVEAPQYSSYKNDPEYSGDLIEVAEMFTRLIVWNQKYEPLANRKVRQAISHAIDVDAINRKFLKGKAYNPVGWLPESSEAFDRGATGFSFDLEKAKLLMKEAGYEKGFELKILGSANMSYGVSVAEVIGQYLSKINIKVTTQQLEEGILYDKMIAGDFQGIIWSFGSGPEPLQALKRWHSKTENTSGNYAHYNNAQYDALLDQARTETDPATRIDLIKQADAVFRDDAAVWLLNYNKAVLAVQPWVHGLKPVAIEIMYQDMADVWVDPGSPRSGK